VGSTIRAIPWCATLYQGETKTLKARYAILFKLKWQQEPDRELKRELIAPRIELLISRDCQTL
jgi:hypothetical protein